MRFLTLLTLVALNLALWNLPIVNSCNDPGGVGCVIYRVANLLFFATAIILGVISFSIFFHRKKNRKNLHKKFFIKVILIFCFANLSLFIYAEYKEGKKERRQYALDQKLRTISKTFKQAWEILHKGESPAIVLSALEPLKGFPSNHYTFYEKLAIRMALAMRYEDFAPVFIEQASDYFSKIEHPKRAQKILLDTFLEYNAEYINSHKEYQRFFSLLRQLKIGAYKVNEIYHSKYKPRYVLEKFTFSKMIEKGFDDLAIEALSFVLSRPTEDLEAAVTMNDSNLKDKVINQALEKVTFQQKSGTYAIDDLILIYRLLNNEDNIDEYLDYLQQKLKRTVQQSKPEEWIFQRTQVAQEEYLLLYKSLKGDHDIINSIPEHINEYYLNEENKVQQIGKDNYRLFITHITQRTRLNTPYTYQLYVNNELRQSGLTDEQGKIEYKVYSPREDDLIEVRTYFGTWQMILKSPPAWDSQEGMMFRIDMLEGREGGTQYAIRAFESKYNLKITGIYNEITAWAAKEEYEKRFGGGWKPVVLNRDDTKE